MRSDAAWVRGFAHPGEPLDASLLEAIVVEHGRQVVLRFVAKYAGDLAARSAGLVPVLERWAASDGSFATAWDVTFGACAQSVIADTEADPVAVAAALGLRVGMRTRTLPWEAQLRSPTRLRCNGALLPRADAVRLEWTAAGPRLHARIGRAHRSFVLGRAGHAARGVAPLPTVRVGRTQIDLLGRSAVDGLALDDERERSFVRIGSTIPRDLTAAFEVLRSHAPAYIPWVTRVLRSILPQRRVHRDLLESGSSSRRPGLVTMTFPVEPAACGELLVHEATHQYLYLLERTGQLDNGTDAALYYSPIKRTDRPIRAILLAFHAMANVLLYYRMCRRSGLDDGGYCQRQETLLLPQLHDLLGPLRATTGLTPSGSALWQSLATAIEA